MRSAWRRPASAALLLALGACGRGGSVEAPVTSSLNDSLPACAPTEPLRLDTIATGLAVPWAATFLSDGRALVTERGGDIRLLSVDGALESDPWRTLDAFDSSPSGGEVGLMGIDARTGEGGETEVFVAYAVSEPAPGGLAGAARGLRRRLQRLLDRESGHVLTIRVDRMVGDTRATILEGIPAAMLHGGGALRFGPDGFLYLATGDGAVPEASQWEGTLRGRILRFDGSGRPAPGNPVPGELEYARGIRSSQGLVWDPETGALWAIDHGPSGLPLEGGRAGNDELNRVDAGDNLGWPFLAGLGEGEGLTPPLVEWSPAIAPAGLDLYRGFYTPWRGDLFISSLTTGSVIRVDLEGGRPQCQERWPLGLGRLRLVAAAPDGSLWVGTSNRDGRGSPRDRDDVLVRLRPGAGDSALADGPTASPLAGSISGEG